MPSILIVDDQRDLAWVLARLFRAAGCAADFAVSGEEALAKLGNDAVALPDVVLLDVMMPGLDGIEVLRRVRGDARTAAVPVVMYSALSDPATAGRAMAAGANGYVVKGVEFDDLRATVAAYARCDGG